MQHLAALQVDVERGSGLLELQAGGAGVCCGRVDDGQQLPCFDADAFVARPDALA